MFEGTIIAESLRLGAALEAVPLTVRRIRRAAISGAGEDQPGIWTFVEFEVEDAGAAALADRLAEVLGDRPSCWYADFRSDRETVVVFPGRIFRYPRGDAAGREEAVAHGRAVGVPEHQLDWPV